MHDQAQTLRKLVRDCLWADVAPGGGRPSVLLVAGAKEGVGTTSVALNLAVALQELGAAAILVDADPAGGDVAALCRLVAPPSVAAAAGGLRSGPGGIRVLSGPPDLERGSGADFAPRWIAGLGHVVPRAEIIIVDAGSGPSAVVEGLWGASDAVLLVTAPDAASVMNGYALLKRVHALGDPIVYCLVNRVPDAAAAGGVFGRIHRAGRRFLGLELRPAGYVPDDPAFSSFGPGAAASRLGPAARQRVMRAASALSEGLQALRAENNSLVSSQERLNPEVRSSRYTRTLSVAEQPLNYAD